MHIYRIERPIFHDFFAEHDHTRDPEEDDVIASDKRGSRIEILQLLRFLGVTERREWPHARAEPCVQHVLILMHTAAALRAASRRCRLHDGLSAFLAIVCRYSVSPPELA